MKLQKVEDGGTGEDELQCSDALQSWLVLLGDKGGEGGVVSSGDFVDFAGDGDVREARLEGEGCGHQTWLVDGVLSELRCPCVCQG